MSFKHRIRFMPTKLTYKLLVAFTLMSLLPMLVGVYVATLLVGFPFKISPQNLTTISFVMTFSLALACLGYKITQQMISPIIDVSRVAQKIAKGDLVAESTASGSGELEELSRSLQVISKNARELLDKVEKLSLKDKLTGLYNVSYIRERLNEEIQRAIQHQRPCSFVYFAIDRFEAYSFKHGPAASQEILKAIAGILSVHLAEFDRAARINQYEFALIFPEKNKRKAIEIMERVQKDLIELFSKTLDDRQGVLNFSVGISENPLDGMSSDELYLKAQDRVKTAKANGPNLIEAFA